jgi:hypothetical protein
MGKHTRPDTFGPSVEIEPGVVFATDFEAGCVAETIPDIRGVFDARDSDGVTCLFSTMMVRGHADYREIPDVPPARIHHAR